MKNIVIAGTDTGIGKTLCSALLMTALEGTYFKPIQSGSNEDNDTNTVKCLSGLNDDHFLTEKYLLNEPLSPHLAAEIDNIEIDLKEITLPKEVKYNPLIIELAGGLMVPITRRTLFIDVLQKFNAEVILCASSGLGTINHALLSIEALKSRNIPIAGLVFIGEENPDNEMTTVEFSGVRKLGLIPRLENINKQTILNVFNTKFDKKYFEENYGK